MERLNYHHLFYFLHVVREGGILPASRALGLAHPTLSQQLRLLEKAIGKSLFDRTGRRLRLTEDGRVVFRYAEEIFALGHELQETLAGRVAERSLVLRVGVTEVLPKLVVHQLLRPALALAEPVRLIVQEDRFERLLGELAMHTIDVVLADAPLPPGAGVRAYNHLLGECGITFVAARPLAARLRRKFPTSIDGAPFLLPTSQAVLRRSLEQWFSSQDLHPNVVAEMEDSALLKVFGQEGLGVFAVPRVIEDTVKRQYKVQVVGRTEDVRERFYAISVERRIQHPAVLAIRETARHQLFDD